MDEEKNILELQAAKDELNKLISYRENLMMIYRELKQSLESLSILSTEDPVLLPIGSGIFLESKIKNKNFVLVGVGSNIFLEMETEKAKEFLKKRIKKVEEEIVEVQTYIQNFQYYILNVLEHIKRKK